MKRAALPLLLAALASPPAPGLSPAGAATPELKLKSEQLSTLSPAMRDELGHLQYLMNAHQARQFLSLPDDSARVDWIRLFWKQRDPTPTTPKNEMEIEHTIRVNLARQFYGIEKWPGWDRRGEVFIRYGPPDYRGKVWGEVTTRGFDPPRELWYYARHNMLVAFEKRGEKDGYIYAIDPLGPAGKISTELAEFLLYDTQVSLSSRIPQDLLEYYATPGYTEPPKDFDPVRAMEYRRDRPREVSDAIDAIMNPDLLESLPPDVSAVFHQDQIREVANNYEIVLEETPSSYPFNFEKKDLPFYFGVDQFRAGEDRNRVDVQVEIPVTLGEASGAAFEETYRAEVVVWDAAYNEISRKEREILFRAGAGVENWANLLPSQLTLSLPRGYYRMALSVSGKGSQRSSSFTTSFSCDPFGRMLSLSDVLFARAIRPSRESSIFTRGAIDVIPHPYRAYSRSSPVPIYFEIYNLTRDLRGASAYTVEYKIVAHEKEKKHFWQRFRESRPAVASRFDGSGASEHESTHVSIDVRNLDQGSYDLLITVTDENSGATAFRRGTFSVVE